MAKISYDIEIINFPESCDSEQQLIIYLDDKPFPSVMDGAEEICIEDVSLTIENLIDIQKIMMWWVQDGEEPDELDRIKKNENVG